MKCVPSVSVSWQITTINQTDLFAAHEWRFITTQTVVFCSDQSNNHFHCWAERLVWWQKHELKSIICMIISSCTFGINSEGNWEEKCWFSTIVLLYYSVRGDTTTWQHDEGHQIQWQQHDNKVCVRDGVVMGRGLDTVIQQQLRWILEWHKETMRGERKEEMCEGVMRCHFLWSTVFNCATLLGLQSLLGRLRSCSVNHLDVGVCRYRLLVRVWERSGCVRGALECPHSWFIPSSAPSANVVAVVEFSAMFPALIGLCWKLFS